MPVGGWPAACLSQVAYVEHAEAMSGHKTPHILDVLDEAWVAKISAPPTVHRLEAFPFRGQRYGALDAPSRIRPDDTRWPGRWL